MVESPMSAVFSGYLKWLTERNNYHGSSETSFTFKKWAPSTAPTAEKVQHDPHKP